MLSPSRAGHGAELLAVVQQQLPLHHSALCSEPGQRSGRDTFMYVLAFRTAPRAGPSSPH